MPSSSSWPSPFDGASASSLEAQGAASAVASGSSVINRTWLADDTASTAASHSPRWPQEPGHRFADGALALLPLCVTYRASAFTSGTAFATAIGSSDPPEHRRHRRDRRPRRRLHPSPVTLASRATAAKGRNLVTVGNLDQLRRCASSVARSTGRLRHAPAHPRQPRSALPGEDPGPRPSWMSNRLNSTRCPFDDAEVDGVVGEDTIHVQREQPAPSALPIQLSDMGIGLPSAVPQVERALEQPRRAGRGATASRHRSRARSRDRDGSRGRIRPPRPRPPPQA